MGCVAYCDLPSHRYQVKKHELPCASAILVHAFGEMLRVFAGNDSPRAVIAFERVHRSLGRLQAEHIKPGFDKNA